MDEELGLLVVADGVSGHAGAEVASKIAVDVVRNSMADPDVTWPEGGLDDLEDARLRVLAAFERANRRVREQAARVEHLEGMATTLVTALVLPEAGGLVVTHVGDSRAYLHRRHELTRLTRDHRLATDDRVRQRLSVELIGKLPVHALTRVIGAHERVEPDVVVVHLAPGDIVLLASDGLTGVVGDDEIAELIDDLHDLGALAAALVERANERGGPDNVTVVVGRWGSP